MKKKDHNLFNLLVPYGFLCKECLSINSTNCLRIGSKKQDFADLGIVVHEASRIQKYFLKKKKNIFQLLRYSKKPVYHALLDHVTFSGDNIDPVWVNENGGVSVAWYFDGRRRILLIGFDVANELLFHTQGNPSKVDEIKNKSGYGFSFERPNYLFNDQIDNANRTHPWADYLGFFLAETLSQHTGFPLVEPLPFGAKGAIALTGDDDQAFLETYQMQLDLIGDLPITYFLHHLTKHTKETINKLPATVEFGLHPDALEEPAKYAELCFEQSQEMNELTGRKLRLVRNHGFLNDGYLGHLSAWERMGLDLDSNYPGVEGTALNGSFLPQPVRTLDGNYHSHYSLLTLFGDGMIEPYGPNLSTRAAISRINQLANQIENSHPGIMVFNFHPQNIMKTKKLHTAVLKIAKRPGWVAIGLDTFVNRLKIMEQLNIVQTGEHRYSLDIPQALEGITLRYPLPNGSWKRKILDPWSGKIEVEL